MIRRRRVWASGLAVKAYGLARRTAERVGLQVVLKTYYSPIPDLATLPEGIWEEPDPLRGIEFDLDAQARNLCDRLSGFIEEFTPSGWREHRYEVRNPSYPLPDARLLYAMVRYLQPARTVELGSGQTTRVIAQACRANAVEGKQCEFHAFDPFPTGVDATLPGLTALEPTPAQQVPERVFTGLCDGDILFVDTTHTVKIGSDVNHVILRILPLLAPGVVVHFHDIALPYEYSKYLLTDYGLYWSEQYLLQAFLSMNPSFEVLYATDALCRDRREHMGRLGLARGSESGSSFWIRRRR